MNNIQATRRLADPTAVPTVHTHRLRELGGIGFVVTTPSAWGWALIPVVIATILFGGAGALAVWGGSELAARIIG